MTATAPVARDTGSAVPVRTWPAAEPALPPAPSLQAIGTRWTVTAADPRYGTASAVTGLEARPTPVWPRTPSTRSARVAPAAGWSAADDDPERWVHADVVAAVRVFEPADADGDALFARLTAIGPADTGRPDVEHLPDELADGLLVARREVHDGALSFRVDLARRAWDVEVLVSARLADPASADLAVAALVRLLAAVHPDERSPR